MFTFLPSLPKGVIAATLFALNTLIWCTLLYPFAIIKALVPVPSVRAWCSRMMFSIGENWISCNDLEIKLLHKIDWDVRGLEGLRLDRSYLICVNHQSWVDIVVLQHIFNRRIPFLRFFLKQQLIWVPMLGLAWWAMDFPFMKRHSKAFLEKYPERRGEDLETTKRACERFRGSQITVLNFLEGTRFTKEKHRKQNSPFAHLLKPKTGGIAFVIDAMGDQFDSLLDVTIHYPEGAVSLWGLLSGKLDKVVVDIKKLAIPRELLGGNYLQDEAFRDKMQAWVRDLWQGKDQRIANMIMASKQ